MFPDEVERFPLQKRYPAAARSDRKERVYVLRDTMGAEDVAYNCRRLRGEANSKAEHAAALEQWWEAKQASETVQPAA
jgi:hypothetical protein